MKRNFLIFLAILGMFLLPNGVFAKEYTFKIGDNGDYNINTFNQFSDWLEELIDQDFSDENVNNTYNLIFEDGNYDYSDFYIPFYDGVFNIYFGKGLYKFDSLNSECCILNIYGKGIDETILNSGYIGGEEVVLSLQGLTIQYTNPRFTWYTDGTSFLNRYSNFKDYDFVSSIKNVVFDFIEPISDFNIDLYFDDIMVKFILDNISFKGISPKTMNFYFYSHSNDSIRKSDHYFDFKNCDFSDINLIFDSSVNLDHSPVVYFSNMKLNNVYTSGLDVQFDCDCSFVNGLRKGSGQLNSDEAFEQYSLYNNSGDGEGATILTESCKQKEIKINSKMSYADIEEELGFRIDESWKVEPEGIIEFKDGKIVPLKVGSTKISKIIDGEIQSLIVIVTDVEKELIISNPETGMSIIGILLFLFVVIIGRYVLHMNKHELK